MAAEARAGAGVPHTMALEWQLHERIGVLCEALQLDCFLYSLRCAPGKGSFGAVYRGVHVHTGEEVAVKIINLEDACAPSGSFRTWCIPSRTFLQRGRGARNTKGNCHPITVSLAARDTLHWRVTFPLGASLLCL